VFSGRFPDFGRELLASTPVVVLPDVLLELRQFLERVPKSAEEATSQNALRALGHRLVPSAFHVTGPPSFQAAFRLYAGLLVLRKTPTESDAAKELQRIGVGTVALRKKAKDANSIADELTVATAFLISICKGRRVVLLTADEDLVLQSYKLSSLLWDDYASYLLAEDYRKNRSLFGEPISIPDSEHARKICVPEQSYAIPIQLVDQFSVFPTKPIAPPITVVNLGFGEPEAFYFSHPIGIQRVLANRGKRGPVTSKSFRILNCYGNTPWLASMVGLSNDRAPYIYFLTDVLIKHFGRPEFTSSILDVFRSIVDVELPITTGYLVQTLGAPSPLLL